MSDIDELNNLIKLADPVDIKNPATIFENYTYLISKISNGYEPDKEEKEFIKKIQYHETIYPQRSKEHDTD